MECGFCHSHFHPTVPSHVGAFNLHTRMSPDKKKSKPAGGTNRKHQRRITANKNASQLESLPPPKAVAKVSQRATRQRQSEQNFPTPVKNKASTPKAPQKAVAKVNQSISRQRQLVRNVSTPKSKAVKLVEDASDHFPTKRPKRKRKRRIQKLSDEESSAEDTAQQLFNDETHSDETYSDEAYSDETHSDETYLDETDSDETDSEDDDTLPGVDFLDGHGQDDIQMENFPNADYAGVDLTQATMQNPGWTMSTAAAVKEKHEQHVMQWDALTEKEKENRDDQPLVYEMNVGDAKWSIEGSDITEPTETWVCRAMRGMKHRFPAGRHCYRTRQGTSGKQFKSCTCLATVAAVVRQVTDNDDFIAAYAHPFERVMHRLKYLFSQEAGSDEALAALISFAMPYRLQRQNPSPFFIVEMGDNKKFVACLNALWELAGYYKHKDKFDALMAKFVSGAKKPKKKRKKIVFATAPPPEEEAEEGKEAELLSPSASYLHKWLIPRGLHQPLFRLYLAECIGRERFLQVHRKFSDELGFVSCNDMASNLWRFENFRAGGANAEPGPGDEVLKKATKCSTMADHWAFLRNYIVRYVKKHNPVDGFFQVAHPALSNGTPFSVHDVNGAPSLPGMVMMNLIGEESFHGVQHSGDVGVVLLQNVARVFQVVDRAMEEVGGFSGKLNDAALGPVNGCPTLRYKSTSPMDKYEAVPRLLYNLSVGLEVGHTHHLERVLGATEDSNRLVEILEKACIRLMPPGLTFFGSKVVAGVMKTVVDDLSKVAQRLQVPHTDFNKPVIKKFEELGILPFTAVVPLSKEGSTLWVHKKVENEGLGLWSGNLIHVPHNSAFIIPGTMAHSGGFRTGPTGNPRMHFVFFLMTRDLSDAEMRRIPKSFTNLYFSKGFGGDHEYSFQVLSEEVASSDMVALPEDQWRTPMPSASQSEDPNDRFCYPGIIDYVMVFGS